jgi:hypothetical protein
MIEAEQVKRRTKEHFCCQDFWFADSSIPSPVCHIWKGQQI